MGYYGAVVLICCICLITLSAIVAENARLDRKNKKVLIETYIMIGIAILVEWGAVLLNGAPRELILLHKLVKCADYIISPMLIVFFFRQIASIRENIALYTVYFGFNTILQISSIFTGWTFYVDETNNYGHGPYHIIYVLIYMIAIVYCVIKFFIYGRQFRRQNRASLTLMGVILVISIILQETGAGGVRVICIGMVMISMLLLLHSLEYQQQETDDNIMFQKRLLETDVLTGLLSRYSYSVEIERMSNAGSVPNGIVIFSMDVNGLKKINDEKGHAAGDELIRGAAECMKKQLSEYGNIYRTGGDEFIGICRMSKDYAERMELLLKESCKIWKGTMISGIALSVGYSFASDYPDMDIEKLITEADKKMYIDKNQYYQQTGNNR